MTEMKPRCSCRAANCVCKVEVEKEGGVCIGCINNDHQYTSLFSMMDAKGVDYKRYLGI